MLAGQSEPETVRSRADFGGASEETAGIPRDQDIILSCSIVIRVRGARTHRRRRQRFQSIEDRFVLEGCKEYYSVVDWRITRPTGPWRREINYLGVVLNSKEAIAVHWEAQDCEIQVSWISKVPAKSAVSGPRRINECGTVMHQGSAI